MSVRLMISLGAKGREPCCLRQTDQSVFQAQYCPEAQHPFKVKGC